jgi:hypothetical protein
MINTSGLSASVQLQVLNQDGTVNAGATFTPSATITIGSKSQGFGATPSPNPISGSTASTLTLTYPSAATISLGGYYVQALATLGSVQRQATVHIAASNSNPAHSIAMSGFFAPDGNSNFTALAPSAPATNVQINGPVAEQVALTLTCTDVVTCGQGHTPHADMSFSGARERGGHRSRPRRHFHHAGTQVAQIDSVPMSSAQTDGPDAPVQNSDGSDHRGRDGGRRQPDEPVKLRQPGAPYLLRRPGRRTNVYNLGVEHRRRRRQHAREPAPSLPPGQNYNASITLVPDQRLQRAAERWAWYRRQRRTRSPASELTVIAGPGAWHRRAAGSLRAALRELRHAAGNHRAD